MLDKIKKKIIIIYVYIKEYIEDIWPYKYFLLIYLMFIASLAFETFIISMSRVLRFCITCIILLIYKKLYNYIENKNIVNINIKYLKFLIKIHIFQNPILYLIWKWDLYILDSFEKYINNIFTNSKIKQLLLIIFWNISVPIKFIYKRFYDSLSLILLLKFKDFMFMRIYGFLISLLIYLDILQYLGGFFYLIIYVYFIMYIINIIYIMCKKYIKKDYYNLKIIKLFKKSIIYKIFELYFELLNNIEIFNIYQSRFNISLIGFYIKKCLFKDINIIVKILNEIPEQLRYWIYRNWNSKLKLSDNKTLFGDLFFISYKDGQIMSKIVKLKLWNSRHGNFILKLQDYDNNFNYIYYKYLSYYYDTYFNAICSLHNLFRIFESVLYYKYYIMKAGFLYSSISDSIKNVISIQKYEYIYNLILLILKNILFFIWSFEYYILKDKNKLTKLYVIKDINIECGYHIYSRDTNFYNDCNIFPPLFCEEDLKQFVNNNNINNFNFNNVKEINEKIFILVNIIKFLDVGNCIYVELKNNVKLKDLNIILNEYLELVELNTDYENNLYLLKPEMASAYFVELNNVINCLTEEWQINYMNKVYILEENTVFLDLVNHLNI